MPHNVTKLRNPRGINSLWGYQHVWRGGPFVAVIRVAVVILC